MSSSEEWQSGNQDYECCTSRGSVVALNANSGEQIWKTYTMDTPKPTQKNDNGVQLYGPAGGSVWNSPTVDPVRHAVYFGTGDTETEPRSRWETRSSPWIWIPARFCGRTRRRPTTLSWEAASARTRARLVREKMGPDADIGNSPILRTLPDGKRVLIAGTKGGEVFALDPDNQRQAAVARGRQSRAAAAAASSGAARPTSENVYYGMGSGGMSALKMATGQRAWFQPINAAGTRAEQQRRRDHDPGRGFRRPARTASCTPSPPPMAARCGNSIRTRPSIP